MKILAVGGGSGGHVTPVLAVINELSKRDSNLEVFFLCDRKFGPQAEQMMQQAPVSVETKRIYAGKFRRYHGMTWRQQLMDVPTVLQNIRDGLFTALGVLQSFYYLLKWRPDVVFTKGGFVCLPVGLVAHLLRFPLVIHDSDARPGLTNRILSRWADRIATGAPLENYPYNPAISTYVGVPVDQSFTPFTDAQMQRAKDQLGLPDITTLMIAVTGGGLGARRINTAIVKIADRLIEAGAAIVHVTGKDEYDRVNEVASDHAAYRILPFVHDGMAKVLGAADIIVTRAGATSLLEVAALGKATVIIPNKMLGDQVKNALVYAKEKAAVMVDEQEMEKDPELLLKVLVALLKNDSKRRDYGKRMHAFAKPDAASDMAEIIVDAAKKRQ